MKALENLKFWFLRPSRLLGLLLFAVLVLYASLVWWVLSFPDEVWLGVKAPANLDVTHWLGSVGVVSAICGWIVAGIITVRNSTKQHTMSLLLESRLSSTYMGYANWINSSVFDKEGRIRIVPIDEYRESQEAHSALNFILNFFEFVAVGIRCGDLDERIVKNTHRGLIVNMVTASDMVIRAARQDDGKKVGKPKCFEHLLWLDARWRSPTEDALRLALRAELKVDGKI